MRLFNDSLPFYTVTNAAHDAKAAVEMVVSETVAGSNGSVNPKVYLYGDSFGTYYVNRILQVVRMWAACSASLRPHRLPPSSLSLSLVRASVLTRLCWMGSYHLMWAPVMRSGMTLPGM
jgi:hypothetical protein